MLQCNCAQYCSQYYKLHNIMTFIITSSSLVDCVSDLQGFWCCAAGIVRGYVTYSRLPSLKIQIVLYLGSLSNERDNDSATRNNLAACIGGWGSTAQERIALQFTCLNLF